MSGFWQCELETDGDPQVVALGSNTNGTLTNQSAYFSELFGI